MAKVDTLGLGTSAAASTASTSSTKALQYGATGDDVKALQTTLNSLGYSLDVDGSFGPATQAAVKAYQQANGLAVDGSVGPQTSASLAANSAAQTTQTPAAEAPVAQTPAVQAPVVSATMPNLDAQAMVNQQKQSIPDVSQSVANQQALLNRWQQTAQQQSDARIDYATQQGVTELERALEDAQPQFKEQQESITKEEMQARDNSALYAEARGDKGGIGQEQYNSIMNTAAQNRLAVQQAQTKLSTDTQRQIADLRAQGEFDKADAALEISQQYLSQLMSLEQWAFDAGLSAAQFKVNLDQWLANYEMAMAEYKTGIDQWNANYALDSEKFQYDKEQDTKNQLASAGEVLLSMGVMPSASQLAAMGMDTAQAQNYIAAAQLAAQSGQGQTGDGTTPIGYTSAYQSMYDAGITNEGEVYAYLKQQKYSDDEVYNFWTYYQEWLKDKPSKGEGTTTEVTDETFAKIDAIIKGQDHNRDGEQDRSGVGMASYLAKVLKQMGYSEEDIHILLQMYGYA